MAGTVPLGSHLRQHTRGATSASAEGGNLEERLATLEPDLQPPVQSAPPAHLLCAPSGH
jgi:hypothetical protein